MTRLFWKFFAVIWLCIFGSVAVLFVLLTIMQVVPVQREREQARLETLLQVTSYLVETAGPEIAAAIARKSATDLSTDTNIEIKTVANRICEAGEDSAHATSHRGICYRVSAELPLENPLVHLALASAPWLSTLLAAGAAGYLITTYLIFPIEELRAGLKALANGRFGVRIAEKLKKRRDELTELASDFDKTASQLETLQRGQQMLFHDVSHELRSPLARLRAAIGVIEQNPQKVERLIPRLIREVERTDTLVGEVLALARMTDGARWENDPQLLDVIELLDAVIDDAKFEASAKSITITYSRPASYAIQGHEELLIRAFENVLRNAIAFSPLNGLIRVNANAGEHALVVTVADEGPGVPADALEHIFDPFFHRSSEGHGLGLAIARRAVDQHKATLSGVNLPGGGFEMTFVIPQGVMVT